jgi:hypothetical protein
MLALLAVAPRVFALVEQRTPPSVIVAARVPTPLLFLCCSLATETGARELLGGYSPPTI